MEGGVPDVNDIQLKTVRLERTAAELKTLQRGIRRWLKQRRDADVDANGTYVGRHKTQFEALESMLPVAAAALDNGAHRLLTSQDAQQPEIGAFYDACRDYDQAAVWLYKLWDFFRQKLDQRDQDQYKDVLKAADEVVWSCYHAT
jgi:hypothetical protein